MTLAESMRRLVVKFTKWAKLHPKFSTKIVQQNGDLTLELQPDIKLIPGSSNLPMRVPAPGMVLKVAAGSRCLMIYENGDRKRPVGIALFEKDAGSLLEFELHADTKASLVSPDVRLGDTAATEPLVLGTANEMLESTYDTAQKAAATALGIAAGSISSGGTTLATKPAPALSDINTLGGLVASIGAALTALSTAQAAASKTRSSGRAATLSAVSKTV
jgi:hypothetical protein